MKTRLFNILSVLIFLGNLSAWAQTTNTGILYVSPDTKFSTLQDFNNTLTGESLNDGEMYIYESFNNDGTVDFYQETGTTFFIGNNPQLISGAEDSYFYNINFNNLSIGNPFQLTGKISAVGEVNFLNGIVDIDNFGGRFTFVDNASHINTSNNSYVDGPVEKFGTTDFIFPIGDAGFYRFAGISEPLNSSAIYQAHYFLENPGIAYDLSLKSDIIEVIDNQEYWKILPIGMDESIMITLSWNSATTPEEILVEPQEENIHIVRWDVENNMWVDEGGVVNVNNKTVTTAVSKFGIFTLARVFSDDILPCDLVVYNAVTPNGDGINDYFIIDQTNNTCAQNLHVQVFNRWGVKVYETNNYGESGNVFRGYSEGRMTIQGNNQLPTGTYFYILDYQYDDGSGNRTFKKAGYLYLNGN